jgi:N-formylglutamate deformylase
MTVLIPGVLIRRDPEAAEAPLVFDSPHSGTEYPEDFRFSCPLPILRTAEDTHVEDLYEAAPRLGATLLAALFPRSYLDLNRDVADIDVALLAERWDGEVRPSEKTRLGQGLIRRLARPGLPLYDRKLGVAEIAARIVRCYLPYHAELQGALDRLHHKFGAAWLIDCHSMPTRSGGSRASSVRPDFVLGDRDGTTCAPELTDFVRRLLTGRGYAVALNDPYKGVEIVRRHGRPAEGFQALQIEVNRSLYMDERTLAKKPDYTTVKADLTHLIGGLASVAGAARVDA